MTCLLQNVAWYCTVCKAKSEISNITNNFQIANKNIFFVFPHFAVISGTDVGIENISHKM